MASNASIFNSPQPLSDSAPISIGNGALLPVTHRASNSIATAHSPLLLKHVLVSPSLIKNLVYVCSLTRDHNVTVEFDPFDFSIKDIPTRTMLLRCDSAHDLYPLTSSPSSARVATTPTVDHWHLRLGHPRRQSLHQTLPSLDCSCSKFQSHSCQTCQLGKHVRLPFSFSNSVSYVPFQIIQADVWTSPVHSCSGFKYYLVFIDDLTHYIWTFPLHCKSDVFACFLSFHAYVTTQFQLPIISFQSDNGKEFDNNALCSHLSAHGISLRLSCPYTSSQNGKTERIIQTINDCVRSMLLHAGMPPTFLVKALSTATQVINRRLCQASGHLTPHQLLLGAPPSYDHLHVFGCLCFPNQSATTPNKLSARSCACVFLGYLSDHRGYRCFDLATRRVINSHHVSFDEH
jgi:histone deacetylase 1/2